MLINLPFLFKVYIMKDIPLIRDAQLFPNTLLCSVFLQGVHPLFVNAATVTWEVIALCKHLDNIMNLICLRFSIFHNSWALS